MPRKPLNKYPSTCICHSLNLVKSNGSQTRIAWALLPEGLDEQVLALFCWHIDLRLKTGGLGWNFPLPWNLSIYTVIVQLNKYHLMSLFLLSSRTAISSCLCSGPAAVLLAKHWYPLWGEPGIDTLHVILELGLCSPCTACFPLTQMLWHLPLRNVSAYPFITTPAGKLSQYHKQKTIPSTKANHCFDHHPILQNYQEKTQPGEQQTGVQNSLGNSEFAWR